MQSVSTPSISSQTGVYSVLGHVPTSSRLSSPLYDINASKPIRAIAPIPFIRSDNPGLSPQPPPSTPLPTTLIPSNVCFNHSPLSFPVSPLPTTPLPTTLAHEPQPQSRLLSPPQPLRINKRQGSQRLPRCEPLTISRSKDSSRWSDVVPPESALFFAVVWDDNEEIVAFSPADIARHSVLLENDERGDSADDDDELDVMFYEMENDDGSWDGVHVAVEDASEYGERVLGSGETSSSVTISPLRGPGDMEELTPTTSHYPSLNSSTYFQIIRDHGHSIHTQPPPIPNPRLAHNQQSNRKPTRHGLAMGGASSSHPSLASSIPLSSNSAHGNTRTSSTLGGLDVYLKGLPLKKTHRHQPVYSVLEFDMDGDLDARLRIDSINFSDIKAAQATSSARESKFSLPWTTIEPPTSEEVAILLKEREMAREKAGRRLKKRSRWALVTPTTGTSSTRTSPSHANPLSSSPAAPTIKQPQTIPLTAYLRPSPRFPCRVPTSSPPSSPPARLTPPALKRGISTRLGGSPFGSLSRSSSTIRARSTSPTQFSTGSIDDTLSRGTTRFERPTNPQATYFERGSQHSTLGRSDGSVVGTRLGMGFCQPLFSNVFRFVGGGDTDDSSRRSVERIGEWVVVDGGDWMGRLEQV